MDIEKYISFFEKYTNEYLQDASSETEVIHLNRKKEHSYRVVEFALRIAKSLNLNEHDISIINTITLFHDIGRFEQFKKYGTYDDLISENHALLSLKKIDETGILKELKISDINTIRRCVFLHNEAKLPENITDEERIFSCILRDADKLDSMKAMNEIIPKLSLKEQSVFYTNKEDKEYVSDLVYNSIMNKQPVLNRYLATKLDKQVRIMGFITSDMNYKESFKIISENNWLNKMYQMLPKQERVDEIYNMTKEFIDSIEE